MVYILITHGLTLVPEIFNLAVAILKNNNKNNLDGFQAKHVLSI